MALIPLDVEVEDHVDGVLYEFRSSGDFGFCDLSDDKEYEVSLLGEAPQQICALSDLSCAPRQCVRAIRVHRLN